MQVMDVVANNSFNVPDAMKHTELCGHTNLALICPSL